MLSGYIFVVLAFLPTILPVPACKISEFACRNSKCIRLDQYCDGFNQCGDKSDEPLYCSGCNRTYYGDAGQTYEMEVRKPRNDRVPFLCHLTFTANGHAHGDFIQLLFDSFHVGRYDNRSYDGCPDGYMQIMELGRPFTGGSWCGPASGLTVYYSETNTITVSIRLHHLFALDGFLFKIRYRFLTDEQGVVRFGSPSAPLNRGEVVPGTYCSRNFYECYRQRCRLQSPNYPGMYPRNVTCFLTLKQKELPTCKHALISVSQFNARRMQIKRSVAVASMNKSREIRTWNDCSGHSDHLVFYDGPTTEDPVLIKFCGGDWLPHIASRGPEMLVAFHSSAYSMPLDTIAHTTVRGFELEVNVVFVDSDSYEYTRTSKRCEFWVNASSPDGDEVSLRSKGRVGAVKSPRHTLPPNTTCTWNFVGQPADLVWISFITFYHDTLIPIRDATETGSTANRTAATGRKGIKKKILSTISNKCSTRLRIWDGGGKESGRSLFGDHCGGEPPRLCDHASLSNTSRTTRPCGPSESYTSTGRNMAVQLTSEQGTALYPVYFKIWYEFVDTRLGGEAWVSKRIEDPPSPCVRIFRKMRRGEVHSPRNMFLYGKGGARNLTCIYRIEASPSERIKLTIVNASFGDGDCVTEPDPHTTRPRCVRDASSARLAELEIAESPWREFPLPRACFCDNSSIPIVFLSSTRAIELQFRVSQFDVNEDFTDLYFHAKFEIVKSAECSRKHKLSGSGGEMEWTSPPSSAEDVACSGVPWLVEARHNTSLFLLTWGSFLPNEPVQEDLVKCATKNRIFVYSGRPLRLRKVVCPSKPNARQYSIHIFSEEWFVGPPIESSGPAFHLAPARPPNFLVEFLGFEPGEAQVNWLEISRSRSSYLQALPSLSVANESYSDCPFRCPELQACISESLWCDGRMHCPSGFDEFEIHCGVGHRLFSLIPGGLVGLMGAGAAILTFSCLFVALVVAFNVKKSRKSSGLYDPPRRIPTDELLLDPGSTSSS